MRQGAKAFVLAGVVLMVARAAGQQFQLMEASIDEIHRGFQSGKLTCHSLVQQYLDRVKAYDQQGPAALNAMLYVNPKVLEQADAIRHESSTWFVNHRTDRSICGLLECFDLNHQSQLWPIRSERREW